MYLLKLFFIYRSGLSISASTLPVISVCAAFLLSCHCMVKGPLNGFHFAFPASTVLYFQLFSCYVGMLDKVSVAFYKAKNAGSFQDLSLSLQTLQECVCSP